MQHELLLACDGCDGTPGYARALTLISSGSVTCDRLDFIEDFLGGVAGPDPESDKATTVPLAQRFSTARFESF